jgi:hypothetical protein
MAGLRELPEPEERWLAEGLLPEDSNNLWAAPPKTHKTNLLLEVAVSLVTATPVLGRFAVPEPRNVGLVLMEDAKHRVRRRLERIALGRGLTLRDLDGLFFWFRPPLLLSSLADMSELAEHVVEREIDYLHLDSYTYVGSGNSNDADDVAPQLANLSRAVRDARPGAAVGLTHHTRKPSREAGSERLSEMIRNSVHFAAWYDVGLVLSRSDEAAPVKVRCEMRDLPSPDPFMFTVEDQYPAGPDTGVHPTGWLRLMASDRSPALVEREAAASRFMTPVREYLREHDGCSKTELKRSITGDNALIMAAFDLLCERGEARYLSPEKNGMAGTCHITPLDPAVTPLTEGLPPYPADPAVTPVGGTGAEGGGGAGARFTAASGGDGFTCACGCGQDVGGPNVTRIECRRTA